MSALYTRNQFLHIAAALGLQAAAIPLSRAQAAEVPARVGEPIPQSILDAWETRQTPWKRMSCQISGYTSVDKEVIAAIPSRDEEPNEDLHSKTRVAIHIDFEHPRVRWESLPGDQRRPWKVMVHDGTRLRAMNDEGRFVDVKAYEILNFEYRYWPMLFGHGLVGGPEGFLTPTHLRRTYKRDNYEVVAVEKSTVSVCTTPFTDHSFVLSYVVDTAQEGAILSSRFYTRQQGASQPLGELFVTEFRDKMPLKWTYRTPALLEFLRIERLERDPDFSKLKFDFGPE